MRNPRKRALVAVLATGLMLAGPAAEAASCAAAVAAIRSAHSSLSSQISGTESSLSSLINTAQQSLSTQMSNFQASIEYLIQEMSKTLQGEIGKQTAAMRATEEAIATYQLQEELRKESVEMGERLQQPAYVCQTMAMAGGIQNASAAARMQSQQFTQSRIHAMLNERSPQQRILASNARSLTKYCSSVDMAAGRCAGTPEFVNGDISADLMFKSATSDNLTYDPRQLDAVHAYIERVAGLPPPTLPVRCDTDQCKAYEEMRKDYFAHSSMVLNSLGEIASAYAPQTNLAERAGVRDVVRQNDISMMEAVDAFIRMKFSKDAITASATATSPETLLRELVQNDAFRLWMDFNGMRQMERMEAMQAAELAILNTRQMRPALDAQRAAALTSAGHASGN